MSMKVTRLYTYWEAPEAHAVIEFLEVLRDQLWEIYGDQIIDLLREGSVPQVANEQQGELDLDDDLDF